MSDWDGDEGRHWADESERYRRMLAAFGDLLVDAASPRPGERVLDVGCGCGDLSLAAGRAVGTDGAVTGVDLSGAMLEVARARAATDDLGHVAFERADAALFTPPLPVDLLVSRFGVMFFDDPPAAFANLRRSLRPGGRMVVLCWQELLSNDWMMVPGAAVAEVLPLPDGAGPGRPGPFSLSDAEALGALLDRSGFVDIDVTSASAPMWMGTDASDAVAFLRVTGMGRAIFAGAAPDLVLDAVSRATAALEPHAGDDGVVLTGSAWLVTARA